MNKDLVKIIDFWHKTLNFDRLISRKIIENIDYDNKEVVDLIGPRRSGKSSIMQLVISRLNLDDNFLYINFEDPFFIENNQAKAIEELIEVYEEYFNSKLEYLFFDEVQEIKGWEKVIRKFRDSEKYKIFVTGSSSTLLSKEMSSMLTGRHISHKIFPLDFKEYLFFSGINIDSKKDIILKEKLILKEFDNYLRLGGFPEIALTGSEDLLKSYFYDILYKDIIVRYDIRDKEAIEKVAIFLMSNSSKITSIESIKKTYNLSYETTKKFLTYLKDAFLIQDLSQFSFSLKKQSKALKKIYAIDQGLANMVSFRFSEDKGRILENMVFLELIRRGKEIFYYKTKNDREVDFLVKEKTALKELIQVSWEMTNKQTEKREVNSLLEAMKETKITKGTILTYDTERIIAVGDKKIVIKPVYKWFLDK